MKFLSKNSGFAKFLAVVFSLLILLTATDLPVIVGVVANASGDFSVIVKGEDGELIDGATVIIIPDENTGLSQQSAETENGKATFSEIYKYFNEGGEAFEATYEVEADMYVSKEETIEVNAEGFTAIMDRVSVEGITLIPCDNEYTGAEYSAVDVEGTIKGDTVSYSTDGVNYSEKEIKLTYPSDSKKVWVKVERTGYKSFVDSVYAKVANATFDDSDFCVTPYVGEYDGSSHPIATVNVNPNLNIKVEYSLDSGVTYHTVTQENPLPEITNPEIKKFKIRATSEYYNNFEKEYTAEIYKAAIDSGFYTVSVYGGENGATFDKKSHNAVSVTADGFDVCYSTDGENYNEEIPQVYAAGEYKVYIKLTREHYNDYEFSVTVKINKAKIDSNSIKIEAFNGTFNPSMSENAVQKIEGIESRDKVYYAKGNGEFSSEMPQITLVADSGTYIIKIVRENYEEFTKEFEVTVTPATLTLGFEEVPEKITYKENNKFTYNVNFYIQAEDGNKVNITDDDLSSNIKYSLVDENGNKIDESTGCVTYIKAGNITVKATFNEELANYNFDFENGAATYTIEVVYIDAPEYIISEPVYEDEDNAIKWYNDEVTLKAKDEGWEIIQSNNALGQDGWAESLKFGTGTYNDVEVAFKNTTTGEITDLVQIDSFGVDTTIPSISKFVISLWENSVGKTLHYLTFGIFANDNISVKVYVSDDSPSSGFGKVILYINGEEFSSESEFLTDDYGTYVKFNFPEENISENSKYVAQISANVIDNVGKTPESATLLNSNNSNIGKDNSGLLMIENINPTISEISYAYDGKEYKEENETGDETENVINNNVTYYFDDNVKFSFWVSDADSGVSEIIVKINGTEVVNKKIVEQNEMAIRYDFTVATNDMGVEPTEDGEYVLEIAVVDFAGNAESDEKIIYVDKTAPVITDFTFTTISDEDEAGELIGNDEFAVGEDDIVVLENYGYYFNKDVRVFVTAKDYKHINETVAGIKKILYKAVDIDSGETVVYGEVTFSGIEEEKTIYFDVPASFKGQIYACAVDNLENCIPVDKGGFDSDLNTEYSPEQYNTVLSEDGYVYPNGVILESSENHNNASEDHISITLPETSYSQNDGTALYAKDIPVTVKVNDIYSGIRNIKVTVDAPYDKENNYSENTVILNSGEVENNWKVISDEKNLVTEVSKTFIVKNDSNDISFTVEMTDRAGNTSVKTVVFGIDKTRPKVDITYDNSEIHDEENETYFRTDRIATITVTERNFRASNVTYKYKNTDGVLPGVDLSNPDVWKTTVDKTDPNSTTHTARVSFTADGDYTFEFGFVDNAGNKSEDVPKQEFTIDKTIPVVSVVYDNNSARNGNYYNASRVATITIKEHNFDSRRVTIIGTSTDSRFPAISSWRSSGDVHTATISYTEDSKYTFDITFRDMAGNSIVDFAQQEFYIDTTSPEVTLEGIVDKSANADEGNIGFEITATDKNFDVFEPTVKVVLYKNGSFKTETLDIGSVSSIESGKKFKVINIEDDGIYSVSCTVVDKAGNTYTKAYLQNNAGALVSESRTQSSALVTFSVNRNGSVFAIDTYTKELVDNYYVKDVTNYITVIEINADPIVEESINVNGKKLTKGVDYTVQLSNDKSSWYKYTYKIEKDIFSEEGEYAVVISSKDKAENSAFSDVKDAAIDFIVDRTAPVVTIAGLESNGKYKTSLQQVLLVPSDNGGLLKSVVVRTVDENGNVVKELVNLTGEALENAVSEGQISFNLEEGVRQRVQIICEDYAGNISGSTDDEQYTNITVSTNAFVIFWVTDWLRWTTIITATLLIALLVFVVVKKRKKA